MIGDRIRLLREKQNLSQVQLAEKINVSKQSVSNWENNNIVPSIDILKKLALFFNVSTDYLLELNDRIFLEVTGLSETELFHLQQIANDITSAHNNF
ncbi:MAG: helix-turn-helix domain-containing protein [Negativibacillus massiliensis]|uniref:helix-turn-helix domain-containing protein n=1 Tax=Negativibacillus massiliensis TaxID=1871035 RepID=UPI00399C30D2